MNPLWPHDCLYFIRAIWFYPSNIYDKSPSFKCRNIDNIIHYLGTFFEYGICFIRCQNRHYIQKRTLHICLGVHQRGNSNYDDGRRCVWTYVPLNTNWLRLSVSNVLTSTLYSCINTPYRIINYVLNRVSVTNFRLNCLNVKLNLRLQVCGYATIIWAIDLVQRSCLHPKWNNINSEKECKSKLIQKTYV